MNVLTFTGNLGKDCRLNTVGQNKVANFSVAMTEGFGDNKKTHWVDCALWGKQAESLAQYLVKGQSVAISGEGGMKEASGEYKAALTCRVNQISLIGGKKEGEKQQQAAKPAPEPAQAGGGGGNFDDDIPFSRYPSNYAC